MTKQMANTARGRFHASSTLSFIPCAPFPLPVSLSGQPPGRNTAEARQTLKPVFSFVKKVRGHSFCAETGDSEGGRSNGRPTSICSPWQLTPQRPRVRPDEHSQAWALVHAPARLGYGRNTSNS